MARGEEWDYAFVGEVSVDGKRSLLHKRKTSWSEVTCGRGGSWMT